MSDTKNRVPRRPAGARRAAFRRSLLRDVAGNVLPLAAVGTMILAGLVGGAVDMGRAYKAERRLQAACDAGALAARRAVTDDGFTDAVEQQAEQYFDANYDSTAEDTGAANFEVTSEDNGNTIVGTASTAQNTVLMKIFGFESMALSVSCTASMGVGNSDIMFVLDNTGSMDWSPEGETGVPTEETRMYALQQAMMSFYDTVASTNAGSNARIRFGFVPYSSSVNVGSLLMAEDATYVADTMTVSTRQPVNWGPVVESWSDPSETTTPQNGNFTRQNPRYTTLAACNSAKPADETTWTNYDTDTESNNYFDASRGDEGRRVTATGTTQYQRQLDYECIYRDGSSSVRGYYVNYRYITREVTSWSYQARDPIVVTTYDTAFANWLYRPVEIDVSSFKTGSAQRLVSSSSGRTRWNSTGTTWGGCIHERETTPVSTFAFVSLLTGITPGEAIDLDIDTAPTSDATSWKPMWPAVTFRRGSVEPAITGNSSSASYGCPHTSQLLGEMDEEAFDAYVDALSPTGSTYHDIGLLWGARLSSPTGIFADNVNDAPDNGGTVSRHLIFMTDGELQPSATINSAYGIEEIDRRVTTDGTDESQYVNHRARYLAVCEAIKARGIRLWVIAFGSGVDLSADLLACASTDSAFKADDSEELDQYFQEIARQVGELRITQ
jgi:Flp pilus assembly protein TadG